MGPFKTATAFFETSADSIKFKWDKKTIIRMMERAPMPTEQTIASFPSQIKAMASRLSLCNGKPFPQDHDDFLHSNIIVGENSFDVTGINNREGACTVLWELIAFPDFRTAVPVSLDLPEKYGQDEQSLDKELREAWRERMEYIEMVKSAELQDDLLSACLSSRRSQAITYSYRVYTCTGKWGSYGRVIDELERI